MAIQNYYVFALDFPWCLGSCVWNTYGVRMEYLWSTYGVLEEYLWGTWGLLERVTNGLPDGPPDGLLEEVPDRVAEGVALKEYLREYLRDYLGLCGILSLWMTLTWVEPEKSPTPGVLGSDQTLAEPWGWDNPGRDPAPQYLLLVGRIRVGSKLVTLCT